MNNYICCKCKEQKAEREFYFSKKRRYSACKTCVLKSRKVYRDSGKVKLARDRWLSDPDVYAKVLTHTRNSNFKRRLEVLVYYSGSSPPFCKCCGESEYSFLALDHIDKPKPGIPRAGTELILWVKQNNFPPEFQVLCHNCNMARSWNGGICPHQTRLRNAS